MRRLISVRVRVRVRERERKCACHVRLLAPEAVMRVWFAAHPPIRDRHYFAVRSVREAVRLLEGSRHGIIPIVLSAGSGGVRWTKSIWIRDE